MAPAVLIQNLQKRYGSVEALKDVPSGRTREIFGLLGPNGAGKTTTLRILCTLSTPDAGQVEVSGIPLWITPAARQRLAMWPEVVLDKVLTGRELLQQAALYHLPSAVGKERINTVLALLSLEEWADKRIGTYSGVCANALTWQRACFMPRMS